LDEKTLDYVDEWFPPEITAEPWEFPESVSLTAELPEGFSPPPAGKYRLVGRDVTEASGEFKVPAILLYRVMTRREERVMPLREGQILRLGDSRLFLAKILPFRTDTTAYEGNASMKIGDSRRAFRDGSGMPPTTTVIFYCIGSWGLEAEALLSPGESPVRGLRGSTYTWIEWMFEVKPERIESLRIQKEREDIEIIFRVPELNAAERVEIPNSLDILIPGRILESEDFRMYPTLFLEAVLGDRFEMEKDSTGSVPVANWSTDDESTIREILNRLFPGRWWVSGGKVRTTRDRFGGLMWKVRQAVGELTGGEGDAR
jgi:hypothetical protein